jgi:hypothetical protein
MKRPVTRRLPKAAVKTQPTGGNATTKRGLKVTMDSATARRMTGGARGMMGRSGQNDKRGRGMTGGAKRNKLIKKNSKGTALGVTIMSAAVALFLGAILVWNFLLPGLFPLQDNYNLLLVDKGRGEITLVHFNTEFKVIKEVAIDPQLKVKNFSGEEKAIRTLLADLLEQGREEQFWTAQYSFALEESLDEVLVIEEKTVYGAEAKIRKGELQSILWRYNNDLMHKRLIFFLNGVASWNFETLTDKDWRWFHQESFSKQWRSGQCSIAVLNATQTSGLAGKMWNLLAKDGHKMMKVANFDKIEEKTTIYYDGKNDRCLAIVARAMRVLPLVPEIVDDEGVLENTHKASIVVVAGNDLTQ